ncbi:uncharacterized protein IUM83_16669 [Phytophthora cinnamomi]|uniref:uncharacterized protein n=1 Tax=Phytophthora cinnamomi TaxID=4785 RepID=UPI00355A5288|nr:hypothetical protein IUM83_16669 [Phytophthora cinnamomi]
MSPSPAEGWVSDDLRLQAAEGRSPIRQFPISPGAVNLTSAQRQHYADIVRERVDSMLAHEQSWLERRDQMLPPLDPDEWKQVKMSKQLRFFKRVRRGRTLQQLASEESLPDVRQAVVNGYSSMMCDGQVWGSIEDMMFGMTASSQEDLMTGFWYKNPPHDCVWLGSAEGATLEDPFRSADFIWALPKIAFNVDICYLKATGVERDRDGKRYGYLVLHSVELTQCRPFDARKISRAKMYFTCLFREVTPGYVDVRVRGIFDLGKNRGKIAKKLVTAATKSFMIGLLNGVGIGLAKKLTLISRRNRNALRAPKQSECSVCLKAERRSLFGMGVSLLQCGVCGATVCSNCIANAKQSLFLGVSKPCSECACCRNCMHEARSTRGIRPEDPEFQVIAEYYLKRRTQSSLSLNSPVTSASRSPLAPRYQLDTVTRNRGSRRRNSILKTTWSADMPTNSTADESFLDTDPFSRELDEADFCFSSDEEESNSSVVAQPGPSPSPESSGSEITTVTTWYRNYQLEDDDFVTPPVYEQAPVQSNQKWMERTLFELNVTAQNTYMQTQATMRRLRGAELD